MSKEKTETKQALLKPSDADSLADQLEHFTQEEIATGILASEPGDFGNAPTVDLDALTDQLHRAFTEATLARALRKARADAGLSLADVAARLKVSRGWVHQLEQDGSNLQLHTLQRLAEALGYEVHVSLLPTSHDLPTITTQLHGFNPDSEESHNVNSLNERADVSNQPVK